MTQDSQNHGKKAQLEHPIWIILAAAIALIASQFLNAWIDGRYDQILVWIKTQVH